jgi:hypothetical protein
MFTTPSRKPNRTHCALIAAAAALLFSARVSSAQIVPFRDEVPLGRVCRTVVYDPSLTIQLEVMAGFPSPNGVSFHASAVDSDGGFGSVRVSGSQGESEFGNDTRGSGRMYSLYGSVRPSEGGVQCYQLVYDVTVHVPAGGTRRLVGSTRVKTAKPMPVK